MRKKSKKFSSNTRSNGSGADQTRKQTVAAGNDGYAFAMSRTLNKRQGVGASSSGRSSSRSERWSARGKSL